MSKLLSRYCSLLKILLAVVLVLMVIMVFSNVVLRYIFNSGVAAFEELSRWLLVWLTFTGSIIALYEGSHLGTEIIVSRLPGILKRLATAIAILMMLYATWLLVAGGLVQTQIYMKSMGAASGLPIGLMFIAGLFFGFSAIVILLYKLWQVITGKISTVTETGEAGQETVIHVE